jgi:AmmeMemoRadiSam system protein B
MEQETQKVREPFFAGQFYPYDKNSLIDQLKKLFLDVKINAKAAVAGVAPHAGYVYSGPTAAYLYKSLQGMKPETIVVIGPNHVGQGSAVDICGQGSWETPLGTVDIDENLAEKIGTLSSMNIPEHSVEVQLPFLQHAFSDHKFKIVPIHVMDQSIGTMKSLGEKLAKNLDVKKHIVIASSDFSHYVPQKQAYENDFRAIAAIKELDVEKLYKVIQEFNISMCGYGPISAVMTYAKSVGAKKGELLKYATSGDATGDTNSVVGYGALAFY